jgi:hypothetical protein
MSFMRVYTGFEISATFEIESVSHFRGTWPAQLATLSRISTMPTKAARRLDWFSYVVVVA